MWTTPTTSAFSKSSGSTTSAISSTTAATTLAAANPARVTRATFPDAGHGLSYLEDTPRYQKLTRDFIESCLK